MKISIVTTAYNSAATIKDTLESILAQTYEDVESVVVDGGSTDNTAEIVASYAPRFKGRLVFVSEHDRGAYDGMNKGFSLATGDVVGILNSDDFFTSPDVLSRVAEAFAVAKTDAVYGDVHYVSPKDVTRCIRYYSSALCTPERMTAGYMPAHPAFYCRTALYQRYGGFNLDFRVAADFDLLLRLLCVHRITATYLPVDCVTMRTGGLSSSGWRSHLQGMRDRHRALRANGLPSSYLRLLPLYFRKVGNMLSSWWKWVRRHSFKK